MSKTDLLKTTTLVTVLSVLERGLGFLYRIILSRTIGAEGVGLYQLSLSVFAVFLTAVASGIPITVSRLLAKYKAGGDLIAQRQTVSAAAALTLAVALPLFLLLYLGHDHLDFLFSDERCVSVFLIVLYGFVFNAVYSVVRGSFWGNRQFFAYSVIEFFEEIVMVAAGSLLIQSATDAFDGAKRAAFAVVLSYIFSFTAAMIYFFAKGGKFANPKPQLKPLLSSAVPITAMRTSTSLVSSLVCVLLPARLMAGGLTASEAMSEYGVVLGMALPVLYTPSTVIGSIALVLTPELSEAYYRRRHGRLKADVEKALRVTILIACALLPFFFVFGEDLGMILFNQPQSGVLIRNGCLMLLPMSLNMIVTSVLNSLNCEKQTLVFFFFGAAALLTSVWFLTPVCGAYALLIGQTADYTVCTVCGLVLLHKKCVEKPSYLRYLAKCLFVAAATAAVGTILYVALKRVAGLLPALFVCGLILLAAETFALALLRLLPFSLLPRKKGRAKRGKSV